MHILFLTPWYPNRHDAMDGIFVRKHAQAVARQGVCVSVIRVRSDAKVKDFEIERHTVADVDEVLVYYPISKLPVLKQISILVNFIRGMVAAYGMVVERHGQPDVCQVNVLTRMGIVAWWLKIFKGIPYAIIEHWGRYMTSRNDYNGFARKRMTEIVCRGASVIMPVSNDLAHAMQNCGIKAKRWSPIHNVVNDCFFTQKDIEPADNKFRLLCVTTVNEFQKNTAGTIRALSIVAKTRRDVHLTIIGLNEATEPMVPEVTQAVSDTGMREFVTFAGEIAPAYVSRYMHSSDALVLFSNRETSSVVIHEALASGLPTVATKLGCLPEIVNGTNGILVEPRDEIALADAILSIMDGRRVFDKEKIRESSREFSYDSIGRQLVGVYRGIADNQRKNH